MVAVEVVVCLSGGAPWGFRLQGGAEHHKPLQVAKGALLMIGTRHVQNQKDTSTYDQVGALNIFTSNCGSDRDKVRRRSKACRAGLKEDDELVAIEDHKCEELSHAAAMSLIDTQRTTLNLRVKRPPSAFHSSSRSTSPRSSTRIRSLTDASLPSLHCSSHISVPRCITSPPDSEAYYGETDSDADTQTQTHRRHRRTPPHARSPGRYGNQEEETSEMSGYESAPWEEGPGLGECPPGVPRRELVYQSEWTTPAHTPHTLTPRTLTPTPDQGPVEGEGEGDSGFQEAGGCLAMTCPPLVSPERAKGALMLGSGRQLVPMVGPQQTPLSDELATTYKDKARQAKLHRGESVVEKQVKEARTKCRSIASLLTDAPNPNSKGVLMFKKRRQRAKKYTLTCFGKAEGDIGGETEGETGGETEEEGGSSILSGSEVDEEGFSGSFDQTWDSGYLDLLDRRSSACPLTTPATPTTPTANHSAGLDISTYHSPGCMTSVNQSPGLDFSRVDGSAYQGGNTKRPIITGPNPAHMSPPAVALTNGGSVAVSRASVVLSPPSQTPLPNQTVPYPNPNPSPNPNHNPHSGLNRTAQPFTPGPTQSRLSVAPVVFRPPQPKPIAVTTVTKPVAAVSMVTIPPHRQSSVPEPKRAVSSASLYISPRHANGSSVLPPPPSALSPPPSPATAAFPHAPPNSAPYSPQSFSPPSTPFSPSAAQGPPLYPSPAPPFSPPTPQGHQSSPSANGPAYLSPSAPTPPAPPLAPPQLHAPARVYIQPQAPPPNVPPVPPQAYPPPHPAPSFDSYSSAGNSGTPNHPVSVATAAPPQTPASDSLALREQRISVPAARTGILQDARRRSNKKPMFAAVQNREVFPNPALLSMLQSIDDPAETVPGPGPLSMVSGPRGVSGADAGHESGPEDDWLRLGAEACNFMQSQRGPRPPPVAPKPQAPQVPQLAGKGGQLFARRQNQMDRYVVDRSPSVAALPYSPTQTREASPTPSLPATWKYSSNIRAPPPISYNPLLSPSCPLKAQKPKKAEPARPAGPKGGQKGAIKPVDIMGHQPYQLNSSLFTYGGATPQNTSSYQQHQQREMPGACQGPMKMARVYEVKRFSTPPPTATSPTLKVIAPRSATTLGEPLWRSGVVSPPATPATLLYRPYPPQPQPATTPCQASPQWTSSPLSPPPPPAPTAPLPQLPSIASSSSPAATHLIPVPTFSHLRPSNTEANRQFKSSPDLSPLGAVGVPQSAPGSGHLTRVPRPRFSTSNLGLQPSIWRPGSNSH